MKFFSLLIVLTASQLMAQSPVVQTLAYSRATLPGIPSGNNTGAAPNVLPASYFIYLVVKKGITVSLNGLCLNGQSYSGSLRKVDSPVTLLHHSAVPTGMTDTLVPATLDDVYQVQLGSQKHGPCEIRAKMLSENNQVIVCLNSGQSRWYAVAKNIAPLEPAAAP